MHAVGLDAFGGPEVLHPMVVDEPHAGAGQVRVRVHAAGVNPIDALVRSGAIARSASHGTPELPCVVGMEVSGTIDELGDDLPEGFDLAVGDAVSALVVPKGTHGGYSELVVLPAESVTAMPAGLGFVPAASFLMNALTAHATLRSFGLQPGQTLLVTGAAGAVGGYAVQLAHAAGIRVVATCGAADVELVREFGADEVLGREATAEQVLALAPGGVDAMADTAMVLGDLLGAVKQGGWLGIFRDAGQEVRPDLQVHHNLVMRDARDHEAIEFLRRQVESGVLTTRVAQTFPLDEAAEAHRRLAAGRLRGRLVLTVA